MDCTLIINKSDFDLSETIRKLEYSDIKILSTNKMDEAVKYTTNECIECIIFNVNELNDENIDYIKQLKISKNTKLIPLIIVATNINNEDKITDIVNSGVYDYLQYPNSLLLFRKIKNAIDYKKRYNRANLYENYYTELFKTHKDLCFLLDKNLNIKLFNNPAMKIFKLNQKYIGISFVDIFRNEKMKNSMLDIFYNKYSAFKTFSFKTKTKENNLISWKISKITDENNLNTNFLIIGEVQNFLEKEEHKIDKDLKTINSQLNNINISKSSLNKVNNKDKTIQNPIKENGQVGKYESEIEKLKIELAEAHFQINAMERLKSRLEEFKPEDTEIIERLKKDIEKAKNHNDKLVKILKQYTSKSTWKYLIHRILTHANPDDESDKETFVLEDYGTMVFGDIHGFTKFSERFNPEEVFISLNQMYDIVTRIVYEFDGDIDKFIGDAFFAVFKDPIKAVKAVVRIAKGVDELNDERMMEGHTPLFFRFGINSGRAVRGDIGGELRRENTLIGDSVNIAQRLESSSIPGQILISESTYELVKNDIIVGEKVELQVKGKKNTIIAYYVENIKGWNNL